MRKKADGQAFEKEFAKEASELFYVRRLPTLNTGNAGQTQPADFIVVGDMFNYVELKETARDAFSVSDMQQLSEIEEFQRQKRLLRVSMQYKVIVHFLKHHKYVVVTGAQVLSLLHLKKRVRLDSDVFPTYNSLIELLTREIF